MSTDSKHPPSQSDGAVEDIASCAGADGHLVPDPPSTAKRRGCICAGPRSVRE